MKKIIIVGGGIAGISAGIFAQKAGFRAEVFEKNSVAGGQCMGWERSGHHIDNCIHWLSGTKDGTSLNRLWTEVGALSPNTKYVKSDKFYSSYTDGHTVTLWNDLDRTEREMLALSPQDEVEIKKFIAHVRYAMDCEMPVEKPMDMMGIFEYIKLGKSMANMPKVMKEYGKIDMSDLENRFKHPAIRAVMSDYLPSNYLAYAFFVSYATVAIGNGKVPLGGSLAMTNRMIKKLNDLGGILHTNTPVKKVLINNKKAVGIELEDGTIYDADYVVVATDAAEFTRKLIGEEYMDDVWAKALSNEEKYMLFSSVQTAFSIDKECYNDEGMNVFDTAPISVGSHIDTRMSLKSYEYESGWAPEGKTVLQSNFSQTDKDFYWWEKLTKKEYEAEKERLSKEVERRIITQYPRLEGHIKLIDCWTPMTYVRYCNAYRGAYMSFIFKKGAKPFKVKGTVKRVKNLFLAGQWLQAPGGLPVAVATGKFAIQRIVKRK